MGNEYNILYLRHIPNTETINKLKIEIFIHPKRFNCIENLLKYQKNSKTVFKIVTSITTNNILYPFQ
jgi:hypothetical protein